MLMTFSGNDGNNVRFCILINRVSVRMEPIIKASANIFYCSLNERYDERCKAAEVLGNLVYARCCAKNCPKLKIEHNQENNH